jgi:alpha-mannosidase
MKVERNNPLWFFGIRNPSKIGKFSNFPRDFAWELTLEEPDENLPLEMFLDNTPNSIYKDPDFREECEQEFKKYVEKAGEDFFKFCKIFMIAQSHIDIAWKWRIGQTIKKGQVTFGKAVKHMELFDYFSFSASQPVLFEMIRYENPSLFEKIKEKVKTGQFELVGACWTEPDPRMPSGEAYVKQHLYGQRFFLRHFNQKASISWYQDSFGYSIQIPQLSARSGCKYFFTNKISTNKDTIFPTCQFHWYSRDGSKLLSYWTPGGFETMGKWKKFKKSRRLLKPNTKFAFDYSVDKIADLDVWSNEICPVAGAFYGKGDGGHGPTGEEFAKVRYGIETGRNLVVSTALKFYKELEKYSDRIPEFHDELYYEYHRGTLSTHHIIKFMNRKMEWTLTGLETLATWIAAMNPEYRYPYERITRLWKNVCTLHMHDILPGSSIPEVYDDCYDLWKVFEEWTALMKQDVLYAIKKQIGLENGDEGVLVVNPLLHSRVDLVEIPTSLLKFSTNIGQMKTKDGTVIPIQKLLADPDTADEFQRRPERIILPIPLKALESTALFLGDGKENPINTHASNKIEIKEGETHWEAENQFYKIKIDKANGNIVSCILKSIDKDVLKGPSGDIKLFHDITLEESAWNIDPTYRKNPFEEEYHYTPVKVVEQGPVRWTFETALNFSTEEEGYTNVTKRISIYNEIEGIDIEIIADWHMQYTLMKCFFEIGGDPQFSNAEVPYGTIIRTLYPKAVHDVQRWENHMLTFVSLEAKDKSFNVNLLNTGKYGFDNLEGNKIGITTLRGVLYPTITNLAWANQERHKTKKEGGTPVPEFTDQGTHIIKYKILPKAGSWDSNDIANIAHAFNCPCLVAPISKNAPNLSALISEWPELHGIEFGTLKVAEEPNEEKEDWANPNGSINTQKLVLRINETLGIAKSVEIPIPSKLKIKTASWANLIEEIESEAKVTKDQNGFVIQVSANFAPNEIKTLILER